MEYIYKYLAPAVISYFIGSISFSLIISKGFFNKDVRDYGSGNAGGTNTSRVLGKKWGIAVIVLDALKCICAIAITRFFIPGNNNLVAMYIAAIACMLGHLYPIYFGFKGGKGAAVGLGAMLILDWRACAAVMSVFFVVLIVSKYVSAASVLASVTFPFVNYLFLPDDIAGGDKIIVFLLSNILAFSLVIMHKQNLVRLKNNTENKISFRKKK